MEKEQIEIWPIKEPDKPILRQLYEEIRAQTFTWLTKEQLETGTFDEDTAGEKILVARFEGNIVGFISVWEADRFIHHLYVRKPYQGQGIGQLLVLAAQSDIRGIITLKCLVRNRQAVKFYIKNGWKERSRGVSEQGGYILFELKPPHLL
ncbi:GNAT family N-acetyltransferase [Dyadobacter arcticus]|uniref:Ribosomal protein S18 acetylase RimI-like enzyme n=1 Tax=Dyadobacter arcticus TaxID=1078754 RepID=A0ABX0UPW6_9BACT|nr:GNAT family N-acetyltransferase [Dyadobacter arcticus]NIJ54882.1 ribosomal protein S18 acetylase RimI-like enzyme [Dyadobacter arcticus]